MVDIFQTEDAQHLFHNKFIVIIGDSIQRSVYKDLIRLLQDDHFLTAAQLKQKGVKSILGDELLEGGVLGKLHNGKHYREVRQYHTDVHLIRYYYITRCYGEYMETILEDLQNPEQPAPDVIIMSSCVWDITRYGPNGMQEYKKKLQQLCHRLHEVLTENTMFIWSGALPVGRDVRGGFMLSEISFMNEVLRSDVVEANFYASQVMQDQGYDMIDFHYYFRHQIQHRLMDGIHWDEIAHRRISNMLLTHIAQAWHVPLPSMYKNTRLHIQMKRIQEMLNKHDEEQALEDEAPWTEQELRYGGPIRRPSYMEPQLPPPHTSPPPAQGGHSLPRSRGPAMRQRSHSCHPSLMGNNDDRPDAQCMQLQQQQQQRWMTLQRQQSYPQHRYSPPGPPPIYPHPVLTPNNMVQALQASLQAFSNQPFENYNSHNSEPHVMNNNYLRNRRHNPY